MSAIDKAIGWISPKLGVKRLRNRAALQVLEEHVRKYDAAAKGRRTDGWHATGTSANQEIRGALTRLRDRSREMVRNDVYFKKAVNTIANNTVGSGIVPTPVGLKEEQDKKLRQAWKDWADKKACDFETHTNFYGLQRLVMKTVVESGEALILKRRKSDKNNPLRLQVVEGDYLDHNKDLERTETGGWIIQGVEYNSEGERVAYWIFDRHPSDFNVGASKRVEASEVAHIYLKERPGQVRGVPFGVSSMMRLKDFDDYEDAELVRQKIAACFSVFVHDNNPDATLGSSTEADVASRVEPGIIEVLPPGKSITMASPPVTQNYDAYSRKVLQGGAAGFGISYEAMTGDLTGVNFSSGRMGWLEMQRQLYAWQWDMIIPLMCETVWEWFIDAFSIASGFSGSVSVSWTTPRREMINPVEETKALSEMVRNGFITWQEVVRMLGYDPRETLQELVSDKDSFDKNGLQLACDVRFDSGKAATTEGQQSAVKK